LRRSNNPNVAVCYSFKKNTMDPSMFILDIFKQKIQEKDGDGKAV